MKKNKQNTQFVNTKSKKTLLSKDIKLPTSVEIAQDGVKVLKEVLDELPPKQQKSIADWEKYRNCFMGVEPWIYIGKHYLLTEDEQKNIDKVINKKLGFVVVPFTSKKDDGSLESNRAIINISAVRKIIENYPNIFDYDDSMDIKKYLSQWVNKWFITDWQKKSRGSLQIQNEKMKIFSTQCGLLSGYPLWVVNKFANEKYQAKKGDKRSKRDDKDRFSTELGYISYPEFSELDEQYLKEMNDIKNKSGIKELVNLYL